MLGRRSRRLHSPRVEGSIGQLVLGLYSFPGVRGVRSSLLLQAFLCRKSGSREAGSGDGPGAAAVAACLVLTTLHHLLQC